ncbi:Golgi apparatus membrane protein tvp23 [Galdieria sulphuraria]|nr:Golgi apparatus membrane protein tvp23 [Galdieria sulphuraria]
MNEETTLPSLNCFLEQLYYSVCYYCNWDFDGGTKYKTMVQLVGALSLRKIQLISRTKWIAGFISRVGFLKCDRESKHRLSAFVNSQSMFRSVTKLFISMKRKSNTIRNTFHLLF